MSYKPVMIGPWFAEVRRLPSDSERERMRKLTAEEREEEDCRSTSVQVRWFDDEKLARKWTAMMISQQNYHISKVVPKTFRENQLRSLNEAIADEEYETVIRKLTESQQLKYQKATETLLKKFML